MDSMEVTVIGGVIAWAITGVVTFAWKSFYVRRAITNDIRRQQQRMVELHTYIFTFARKWLVPNGVIETSTYYAKTEQVVYTELMSELLKHSPQSLERVITFNEAVRTVDVLFSNFCTDIAADVVAERPLTEERIKYYLYKIARIWAYTDRLTSFDGSLKNLPSSYDEVDASEMLRRVEEAYGKWTDKDRIIPLEAQEFAAPRLSVKQQPANPVPNVTEADVIGTTGENGVAGGQVVVDIATSGLGESGTGSSIELAAIPPSDGSKAEEGADVGVRPGT